MSDGFVAAIARDASVSGGVMFGKSGAESAGRVDDGGRSYIGVIREHASAVTGIVGGGAVLGMVLVVATAIRRGGAVSMSMSGSGGGAKDLVVGRYATEFPFQALIVTEQVRTGSFHRLELQFKVFDVALLALAEGSLTVIINA